MQCFLLFNPTDNGLRRLIDCREHLQVTTLVDITSVDGKEIMLQAWQGKLYKRKIFSYSRSRQPPRNHFDWESWRQTLTLMLNNLTNRNLKYHCASGTKSR